MDNKYNPSWEVSLISHVSVSSLNSYSFLIVQTERKSIKLYVHFKS